MQVAPGRQPFASASSQFLKHLMVQLTVQTKFMPRTQVFAVWVCQVDVGRLTRWRSVGDRAPADHYGGVRISLARAHEHTENHRYITYAQFIRPHSRR